MTFTENKEFNSLSPEDIYIVSKKNKILINNILDNNLSSIAFVRKNKDDKYEIKPATQRDKKIILQIIEKIK